MVVLIGVLVTQALIAAIQLTIAKVRSTAGNSSCIISPKVVPTKNSGIINPPLQPEVTVMAIARILNIKIMMRKFREK